jgi:hypothetical protein
MPAGQSQPFFIADHKSQHITVPKAGNFYLEIRVFSGRLVNGVPDLSPRPGDTADCCFDCVADAVSVADKRPKVYPHK